mmetsp:Transcript_104864/g.168850  ORF Transcript_104864/g.168850 Transcript_104864/m.168850 type:complete len:386 (+) Transcript_104864:176-1333(+)
MALQNTATTSRLQPHSSSKPGSAGNSSSGCWALRIIFFSARRMEWAVRRHMSRKLRLFLSSAGSLGSLDLSTTETHCPAISATELGDVDRCTTDPPASVGHISSGSSVFAITTAVASAQSGTQARGITGTRWKQRTAFLKSSSSAVAAAAMPATVFAEPSAFASAVAEIRIFAHSPSRLSSPSSSASISRTKSSSSSSQSMNSKSKSSSSRACSDDDNTGHSSSPKSKLYSSACRLISWTSAHCTAADLRQNPPAGIGSTGTTDTFWGGAANSTQSRALFPSSARIPAVTRARLLFSVLLQGYLTRRRIDARYFARSPDIKVCLHLLSRPRSVDLNRRRCNKEVLRNKKKHQGFFNFCVQLEYATHRLPWISSLLDYSTHPLSSQ